MDCLDMTIDENVDEIKQLSMSHTFQKTEQEKYNKEIEELTKHIDTIDPYIQEHVIPQFRKTLLLETPYLKDINLNDSKFERAHPKYLDEKNKHPRDKNIIALDCPHVYYIHGSCDCIISSTTFIHAFFPPFDSEKAASSVLNSKSYKAAKAKNNEKYEYYTCNDADDILSIWDKSRISGTELHYNIECYINSESIHVKEYNEKCFKQFLKYYNDKKYMPDIDFRTEWAIYDEDARIAGKIDYVGKRSESNFENEVVLLDWKRSKRISQTYFGRYQNLPPDTGYGPCNFLDNCNYCTYSLQLNLYKYILEKNYGLKVESMYLIQMHPTLKEYPIVFSVPNYQFVIKKMIATRMKLLEVQK